MKKIFALTFFSLAMAGTAVFGEQKTVLCDSNQAFSENTCDVCYTDTATSTTNILDLRDIKIPWKNTQTTTSEVAYHNENGAPEVVTSFPVSLTPTKAEDLWKFSNPWTADPEEFVLAPGKDVTFLETDANAKITITDKDYVTDKTLLLKAPLFYHERSAGTTESQDPKTRNTCILYTLKFGPTPTMSGEVTKNPDTANTTAEDTATNAIDTILNAADTSTDATDTTITSTEVLPALNSAAEPMPTATSIETGPAENIILLLAVLMSVSIFSIRRKIVG